MKTAKEMFEELGYEFDYDNKEDLIEIDGSAYYYHEEKYEYRRNIDSIDELISFDIVGRRFYASSFYEGEKSGMSIDMSTLKAINKQCEELGWLE